MIYPSITLVFFVFVASSTLVQPLVCARQIDYSADHTLEQNFPPNDQDFYALLSKSENLGKTEELFSDIIRRQNPVISKEMLLKIVEAKQKSISTFRSRYTVSIEEFGENLSSNVHRKISYEFGFSGHRLFLYHEFLSPDRTSEPTQKIAYDGEEMPSLLSYHNGHVHAGIEKADDGALMKFFQPYMPLTLSMLFDLSLCKIDYHDFNLVSFLQKERLYGVFEKKETVDGHECIVVADLTSRIYLDPQKDFSVVKSELYIPVFSDDVLVGRWLSSCSTLMNIVDHGNGIWVPTKAVVENFDKSGSITHRYSIDVSLAEVNKEIDEDYFTGFIPDDAIVSDTANDMIYRHGDRASINDILNEITESKRVWIFQYISMSLGIVMIIIVLVAKYLANRKRKNKK